MGLKKSSLWLFNSFNQTHFSQLPLISTKSVPPNRGRYYTMGTGKKEATRRVRQGKTGDGMGNVKVKGENFYR